MHIEAGSDNTIAGHAKLSRGISEPVRHDPAKMEQRIARLEVNPSDRSADKSGSDDIQYMLQARRDRLHGRSGVPAQGSRA